jgi:3-oxoacyl-[acyl-carrier-protein] synthase III
MPVAPAGRGATGVRVSAVGHTARSERAGKDTLTLLDEAITDCVSRWGKDRGDLDLLVYAGTYRTGFTSEPAIAALAAGRAGINVTLEPEDPRRTLAFDVLNGSLGFLNACHVAAEMIQAGKSTAAMILGGDVENNREAFPAELLGLEETGSAIVLERAAPDAGGFGTFVFTAFPDHLGAFTSRAANWDRKTGLAFRKDADIECRYVQCIATTVRDFLKQEGLEWSAIARVFAPQISSCFLARLAAALELPLERLVDVVSGGRDLYTSSLPFALRHALHAGLVASGDTGLFIGAGAGIQVGCASYRF